VDVAVLLNRSTLSFEEHADLAADFQQLFPKQELDLAIINHADPLFLKKITDNCQILFGTAEQLRRLRIYAFKRFQDHRNYFDMERRYAARFLSAAVPAE
jgi:hypothetical protein